MQIEIGLQRVSLLKSKDELLEKNLKEVIQAVIAGNFLPSFVSMYSNHGINFERRVDVKCEIQCFQLLLDSSS